MAYRYPFSGTIWHNLLSQDSPIYPNTSVTELALEAFAPLATWGGNDGHPSDLYDSLEQEITGRNAEALYFAMFGTKLEADTVITTGHAHQGENTEIEWLPVWASAFPTALASGVDVRNVGGAYADSNVFKELGWAVIPLGQAAVAGQTFLYFRARGAAPAYGSATTPDLDVKVTLYQSPAANSQEITTQLGDPFIIKIPYNTINKWVTAPVVDLGSSYIALPSHSGWKFIYAKFEMQASINPAAVTLYEIQVGRIGGK